MKKWLSMLLFTGIGFGLGFFTGKRVGEHKKENAKPVEGITYDHTGAQLIAEVTQKDADGLAVSLGYTDGGKDEAYAMQQEATDQYFSQFEHPTEDEDDERVLEEAASPNIEVIAYDAYEAETDYEHKSLYFYTEDLVVCDEDEKRIDDPEELVGKEALDMLASMEASAICVRNHWTESVYFVQAIDNAYGRVVLGLDLPNVDGQYPI